MRKLATILAVLAALALPGVAAAYPHATVPSVVAPRPAEPLGPEGGEYPPWGNETSWDESTIGIADCTFAAAADWETIVLHRSPSEAALIAEFHEAGGSDKEGLGTADWESWWAHHGIAGVRVHLVERPTAWLDWIVQRYGAAVAVAANHAVVVDGFNSTGPEVVTYGETAQVTWSEWRSWGDEVFVPLLQKVA
jgi:hypothetical protein